jgi:hypothetical protein
MPAVAAAMAADRDAIATDAAVIPAAATAPPGDGVAPNGSGAAAGGGGWVRDAASSTKSRSYQEQNIGNTTRCRSAGAGPGPPGL